MVSNEEPPLGDRPTLSASADRWYNLEVVMRNVICVLVLVLLSTGATVLAQGADAGAGLKWSGGPDGLGYTFIDSTEAYGPTYSWLAIQGSGTDLELDNNGEANTDTTVFDYYYYGALYDTFRVGNNGGVLVGVTSGHVSANNQELPQVTHPAPMILPFWDDLDDDTGGVYWAEFSTCPHPSSTLPCLVVEWHNRPHSFNVGSATFEMIIFTNGNILFQYADTNFGNAAYNHGASATVGIEDDGQDMSYALQYSFDTPIVIAPRAILFRPAPIFADGFESGNTSAWASASGMP